MNLLLFFFALGIASSVAVVAATTDVKSCLKQGFDPANLSCDTCVLLRETDYHLACLDCCQSYKTLDSKATRYTEAVLVYEKGTNEEIDSFVKDELEQIRKQKVGFSVRNGEGGGGGFFSMSINTLYFYKQKKAPASSSNSRILSEDASETIYLRGWTKDDLKDMINTLLADKK